MGCGASTASPPVRQGEESPKSVTSAVAQPIGGAAGGPRRKTTTNRTKASDSAKKKRQGVSSGRHLDENESSNVLTLTDKSQSITDSLLTAFASHVLFEHLEEALLLRCIQAMVEHSVASGENVITQGDQGDHFYVVHAGFFEAFEAKSGTVLTTYAGAENGKHNRCFGELALMYDSPRACSVRATSAGVVFAIDRRSFRQLVMQHNTGVKHGLQQHLANVPILRELEPRQLSLLTEALEVGESFSDGEYIIEIGAQANTLFLLLEGEVVCHKRGKEDDCGGRESSAELRLKQGEFFGGACAEHRPLAAAATRLLHTAKPDQARPGQASQARPDPARPEQTTRGPPRGAAFRMASDGLGWPRMASDGLGWPLLA